MNPPDNGQYYTIRELVDAKGTSLPVRSALLTMESRILALEHDLAEVREAVVEQCAQALEDDAIKCDCAALEDRECACGAWDDYKSITSARAAEIVRALKEQSK